ncbi:hypothetical protein D9611_008590 [Ephemerocybe angulata]|uniref:Uncharacterized protein n=1 Tax=Ephemerocybe angulata TaxID=980116 RepID=A0A8H5EVB6_9AGAR|nr:hypothetical protein D9611_008590 [Tulosesus angulatus]
MKTRSRNKATTGLVNVEAPSEAKRRPPPTKYNSKVPLPNVTRLDGPAGPSQARRSRRVQEETGEEKDDRRTEEWYRRVPVFRIRGVYLSHLLERGKNTAEGKRIAESQMNAMLDWEADAGSMIVCDEDGQVLVCVFGWSLTGGKVLQELGEPINFKSAPYYPGSRGRTLCDVKESSATDRGTYHDGFTIKRYHTVMQGVSSLVTPVANARDIRHPADAFMAYPEGREGVDEGSSAHESAGVKHFVHGWPMQGHPHGVLYPSGDMVKGSFAALTASHYFEATKPLSYAVRARFKMCFPQYFEKYDKAFKAGQFNFSDPGPFLGRALVWKLQVNVHQDGLDDGPAGILPSGYFDGGELYLPDLKLKLSYRPRDLVFLMAGHLFHAMGRWSPRDGGDDLSPGRAGTVFFFPKASFERLEGKPPRWNIDTVSGRLPYTS